MNDKFDELAKGLAQSVTRRQALRRFGVGLAGALLASLGLPNKAEAGGHGHPTIECKKRCDKCRSYPYGCKPDVNFEACTFDCGACCNGY